MMKRFFKGRQTYVPLTLMAFVASLVAGPLSAVALTGDAQQRTVTVLFVPVQRSAEVPEGVPARVADYFRALVEIEPGLKLADVPEQYVEKDENVAAPVPVNEPEPELPLKPLPDMSWLAKADGVAESGFSAVAKRRFETGLTLLMRARSLYERNMSYLDDFAKYVEVQASIAAGFIEGGFSEEGASATRTLLTIKPDYMASTADGKKFPGVVDSYRNRIVAGGNIVVEVEPSDSAVYVDGRLLGQGNQVVSGLPKGKHYVRVTGPDYFPTTKTVTTAGSGSERKVSVTLKTRRETTKNLPTKALAVSTASTSQALSWYARTGEFKNPGFEADSRTVSQAIFADFVLFSFLARSETAFQLGLFLFDTRTGQLAAIEPALIDTDLGNLQISLLDLEARLAKAVREFSTLRLVTERPAIYRLARAKPQPVPVPVQVPAPQPEPSAVTYNAYQPAPEPTPVIQQAAIPQNNEPAPMGGFEDIPEDFPMDMFAEAPGGVQERQVEQPLYEKWWLWTIVGAVVLGGVGAAVGVVMSQDDSVQQVTGTVKW